MDAPSWKAHTYIKMSASELRGTCRLLNFLACRWSLFLHYFQLASFPWNMHKINLSMLIVWIDCRLSRRTNRTLPTPRRPLLVIATRVLWVGHSVVHLGSRKPEGETVQDVSAPFYNDNMFSMYTDQSRLTFWPNVASSMYSQNVFVSLHVYYYAVHPME